jgi:uncharacterized protein (DUF58 family)
VRRFARALGAFLHPYRRLYLTPSGWVFSAVTLGMGVVAINTGHNLFHLVLALLLSAVIVSGLLSERNLRRVSVLRRLPPEITAGVPFPVTIEVANTHPRRSLYSLEVSDRSAFSPAARAPEILVLGPGQSASLSYMARVEERGRHDFTAVQLSTRFPFGLFEKVRVIPLRTTFVAYPRLREVGRIEARAAGAEGDGGNPSRLGEDVLNLRGAELGDDHRLIHWRTSARRGELTVKEFDRKRARPRAVFFDDRGVEGEAFESRVEHAAALVRLFARENLPLSFSTWHAHFAVAGSRQGARAALRHLALVSPTAAAAGRGFALWREAALRQKGALYLRGEVPPPPLPPCEVIRP